MTSRATNRWPDDGVILYDGVCAFCSRWVRVFRAVPKPLREAAYGLVARNRYRIFGKYEVCFVPDAELRATVME